MTAYIIAIGLIALHALAITVLCFVSRWREQRSNKRIDRARDAVLSAIAALRGDLGMAARGGPPPTGGGALPSVERRVVSVTRDDDPIHTRPTVAGPDPSEGSSDDAEKEVLRAKWEAAEEQRDRDRGEKLTGLVIDPAHEAGEVVELARAAHPAGEVPRLEADDRDTPEDETLIFSADPGAADAQIPGVEVRLRSDRPTMLGGVAHDGPPRPRAAPPTLVSRIELPAPRPDAASRMTASILARYEELCAAARTAGLPVGHCDDARTDCHDRDRDHAAGACLCTCDGCTRATSYAAQAEREIMGPPQGR